MWVFFAVSGPGPLAITEYKINPHDNQNILRDDVRAAVQQLRLSRSRAEDLPQEKRSQTSHERV